MFIQFCKFSAGNGVFAFTQTKKCGKMMAVNQRGRLFFRLLVGNVGRITEVL